MNDLFFTLSKILTLFIFPFPLFFLLSFVSILFVRGFRPKLILSILIFFLGIFSNFFVANTLIRSLEKPYPPVSIEAVPPSEAVIVLGGMVQTISSIPGRPELNDSSDRLVDAVRIYKKGKAKKILFTGGSGVLFADKYREADLALQVMTDLGVPKEDILIERDSKNTYENALFTSRILAAEGIKETILVTSAFHFRRAAACFRKQRVQFYSFPTDFKSLSTDSAAFDLWIPSPGYLEISTMAIKEWIGILAYEFKGYL
ncbi:YdcF family protein [Leptospira idonii]|uniref:YdcF family protein n=1 Tax=Leptospira idonii TaxID=1193500 RepID=A0A4V3JXX4_9LEPT|nr:YdcF family protein [Leptospira idonii]TGN19046.1 YdcF family protein [Leptospira idonii]